MREISSNVIVCIQYELLITLWYNVIDNDFFIYSNNTATVPQQKNLLHLRLQGIETIQVKQEKNAKKRMGLRRGEKNTATLRE